ncbi:MAG: hypothetical protein ACP5P1_13055 [Acidimicrobiales bacterium]
MSTSTLAVAAPFVGGIDPVDLEAAAEFAQAVHRSVDRDALGAMAAGLADKSDWLGGALRADRIPKMTETETLSLLRSFFSSRSKARNVLATHEPTEIHSALSDLVHGERPLADRLDDFAATFDAFEHIALDLPWELLHLYDPARFWLWSSWVWNPRTETGALKLVASDDVDLYGADRVSTYRLVGATLAVLQAAATAAGIITGDPFALDVFLACVYGVYMYTVLRMRMSQEFNRIVPELPSLARRLTGLHQWEAEKCR